MYKIVNFIQGSKKSAVILVLLLFMTACVNNKTGHKITERPSILDHQSVLKLKSRTRVQQITDFIDAHNNSNTAGLCQKRLNVKGAMSNWCIVTEKGLARVIVDHTKDRKIGGYRVSNLKYKGKNRFYNTESRQYISLTPFLSGD